MLNFHLINRNFLVNLLALALRVTDVSTPLSPDECGIRKKNKLLSSFDVMNRHLALYDSLAETSSNPYVWFSCRHPVSLKNSKNIGQAIFFDDRFNWYCLCDVEVFVMPDGTDFVPFPDDISHQVPLWCNQPNRTWIKIVNYRQITREDLAAYPLVNSNKHGCKNLLELLDQSSRFNTAYCYPVNTPGNNSSDMK